MITPSLYQTAGLALRGSQTALHQQAQHVDGAAAEVVVGQLGGGHMLGIACTGEQCLRCGTGLLSFLLTVDQLGQLIGQDVLGLVELGAFPGGHGVDLLQRQEGQHADALQHVGVIHIAPVLASLPSFLRISSVPPSMLLHWSLPPNCMLQP